MRTSSIYALALAASLALPSLAPAADYVIDTEKAHAFVQFRIQHLGFSWLYGRFNSFDGTFSYDPNGRFDTLTVAATGTVVLVRSSRNCNAGALKSADHSMLPPDLHVRQAVRPTV